MEDKSLDSNELEGRCVRAEWPAWSLCYSLKSSFKWCMATIKDALLVLLAVRYMTYLIQFTWWSRSYSTAGWCNVKISTEIVLRWWCGYFGFFLCDIRKQLNIKQKLYCSIWSHRQINNCSKYFGLVVASIVVIKSDQYTCVHYCVVRLIIIVSPGFRGQTTDFTYSQVFLLPQGQGVKQGILIKN